MQVYTKNKYIDKLTDDFIYQNYHKHSIYTNPIITDSCVYPEEYAQRARDLKQTILSSVEHGYGGRAIEYYEMAQKYELKFVYGVEFYFAFDRFEKDGTNAHMVILAKNENGRKAINRILSEANLTGFYNRGRIDYDLIMSLPEDDVWVTTACLASIWKYDNAKINIDVKDLDPKLEKFLNINIALKQHPEFNSISEMLVVKLHEKFKDNFFLEVQAHHTKPQADINKKIIELSKKYNIEIIAGTDSHYIYTEDAWKRDYLQKSSGIFMEEESGWFMDYPDGKTLFNRFKKQGILDDDDIKVALANTNVLLEVEEYTSEIFQKTMKMPSAVKYRNMSLDEKQLELIKIVKQSWETFKNTIPVEQHAHYLREIAKELDTVFKIKHADYFLLNYELIKDAVENRGGMITFSGRGCVIGNALVKTEKGNKYLNHIQIGDLVLSEDGRYHRVQKVYKYDINEEILEITFGLNKLCLTKDHKIFSVDKEWKEAQQFEVGDIVCGFDLFGQNKNFEITKIKTKWFEGFVYDLQVEDVHSYVAENVVVHNSGPSFILNNLLGFTHIDRISSPITLYPERFLSTSRMTAGSLADIDFNCGNTPVFEESQRYVMGGEEHAAHMIAYGTQKPKAAWKMFCRAVDVPFEISNQISAKIDEYETDLKYWDEDSGEDEPNVYDYIPEDLRDYFDKSKEFLGMVTHAVSHPCFLGDTLVRTDDGLKEIQNIQIGDKVLSHDGDYHEVLQTMNHISNDIYEFKTMASIPIQVTGNHPFLVMSKDGYEWAKCSTKGHYRKTKYTEPYWKNVEDLTSDDRIGIKVLETSIIPSFEGLNEYMNNLDFWWIIGRYMGDGWTEYPKNRDYDDKRIIVCCDKTTDIELNEIISVLNRLNWKYRVDRNKRTAYQIYLYKNSILFDFLQQFGRYANGKHLTQTIIDLPINLLKSFLDGYFSADGSITKRGNSIIQHFGTVSKQLFYDLQTCIHKVYHTHVYVDVEKAHKQIIEGRIVNCKDCYKGTFSLNHIITPTNFYKNGYIWVKIKYINKLDIQDKVYNLSINETNTYNVYNHIVHNCGNILYEGNIKEEFGLIRLKSKGGRETIVACIDGKWCEAYLMLKNDLLTVACVKLNYLLYQRIGIPYMSLNQLLEECKQHSEVWDVYEKGYVIGLNQVEKSSTKRKIMKYKPKNISELSALIAGIRPAFKSLIDKLINREHFEYGIPTLDKLLQTEELPESFILYQEQIMKVLSFAGIPMGDCYTVIKSISKKRFEKIMHYKEQFLTGMSQKLIEAENIDKERADEVSKTIWKIIEDASAYGFNSSHSLSVSFDSLLAAYFKALYPLEFYEVYLNLQMERADKAKATLAKKEAKDAFNIKVLPMRFGQDNRKFTAYPEQNALSNCLKSIKGFGDKIGEEFYKIKDRKYDSFLDLLVDIYNIKENKPNKKDYDETKLSGFAVNDTQMETLIKLNYFDQFGKNAKLLKEFKLFSDIYGRKKINKEKPPKDIELDMDILKKYIGKETKAEYKDIDFYGYLKEIFEKIEDKFLALPQQLKFERELFEIPIYENKEIPKSWEYVLSFKTYGDKINNPYLITYNLHNGELTVCQVSSSKLFRDNPFGIYSIIDIKDMQHPFKKKKVGEKKWEVTNEKKNVVADYEVVLRDKVAEKELEEQNNG